MATAVTEPVSRQFEEPSRPYGHRRGSTPMEIATTRPARPGKSPVRQTFDPTTDPAGKARELVRQTLLTWDLPGLVDDALQVTAEMVANAVRGGDYAVTISWEACAGAVRLAVEDDRPGEPRLREPDALSESGRGLLIIDALADDWGWSEHIVWARFRCPGAG
jgi:hypothetical protein